MSKKPESLRTPRAEGTSDAAGQRALFWLGCTAVYAAMACLYWTSLDYPPLSLDDQSQLAEATKLPLSEIWHRDHFGHFRPLKNLLFWLISRTDAVAAWRTLGLLTFAVYRTRKFGVRFERSTSHMNRTANRSRRFMAHRNCHLEFQRDLGDRRPLRVDKHQWYWQYLPCWRSECSRAVRRPRSLRPHANRWTAGSLSASNAA